MTASILRERRPTSILFIVQLLFGLLAVVVGVIGLHGWSTTEQLQRIRPDRAIRWLTVPAVLVAVANIIALGAAMRGNATADTLADYLSTVTMVLLFLVMSGNALQFRRQGRRAVAEE